MGGENTRLCPITVALPVHRFTQLPCGDRAATRVTAPEFSVS